MSNIYILFDCPENKNDKEWLIDELAILWDGEVKSVSINETLSTLSRRDGVKGKLKTYQIMISQAKRAAKLAKSGDIVITWSHMQGLITNHFLLKKDVMLISMNWLTPSNGENKLKKMEQSLASNKNAHIIVNSSESPQKWKKYLGLQDISRIHVIPDVYDSSVPFNYSFLDKEEKYCFTGGMNNRNWKMIASLAAEIPDYKFICVGLEDDFEKQTKGVELPSNLDIQYDIPVQNYYSLMNNAYLVLLPLLSKKVAGLINITSSAKGGVPCIITDTPATRQYYAPENEDMLMDGQLDHWEAEVKKWLYMDKKSYREKTTSFMKYIEQNFSPRRATKKIIKIIS